MQIALHRNDNNSHRTFINPVHNISGNEPVVVSAFWSLKCVPLVFQIVHVTRRIMLIRIGSLCVFR